MRLLIRRHRLYSPQMVAAQVGIGVLVVPATGLVTVPTREVIGVRDRAGIATVGAGLMARFIVGPGDLGT